jgi:FAD:protein FMN transferase
VASDLGAGRRTVVLPPCGRCGACAGPRARRRAGTASRARSCPRAAGVQRIEVPVTATTTPVPTVTHERVTVMGTFGELIIVGGTDAASTAWAIERLEQLEQSWSRFRPGSELRDMDCRVGEPAAASPDLIDAVGRALSLWYVTDGYFDPTIRRALEAVGYDRTFGAVAPHGAALAQPAVPAPGCDGIRIDREGRTLLVPEGVAVDLGGIGKGLAADIVATGLVERGARGACVGLGGDVRVAGAPPAGETWPIRVEDPLDEAATMCTRHLRDAAIVTSTTRFRRWSRGGQTLHHLIDPATGAPADNEVLAVVATGPEAWWAEGVAKAALVAGLHDGIALLERLGVAAVVVETDGRRHATTAWEPA